MPMMAFLLIESPLLNLGFNQEKKAFSLLNGLVNSHVKLRVDFLYSSRFLVLYLVVCMSISAPVAIAFMPLDKETNMSKVPCRSTFSIPPSQVIML
jgi:hypothetical protein